MEEDGELFIIGYWEENEESEVRGQRSLGKIRRSGFFNFSP
jgi:hypothetical protein